MSQFRNFQQEEHPLNKHLQRNQPQLQVKKQNQSQPRKARVLRKRSNNPNQLLKHLKKLFRKKNLPKSII